MAKLLKDVFSQKDGNDVISEFGVFDSEVVGFLNSLYKQYKYVIPYGGDMPNFVQYFSDQLYIIIQIQVNNLLAYSTTTLKLKQLMAMMKADLSSQRSEAEDINSELSNMALDAKSFDPLKPNAQFKLPFVPKVEATTGQFGDNTADYKSGSKASAEKRSNVRTYKDRDIVAFNQLQLQATKCLAPFLSKLGTLFYKLSEPIYNDDEGINVG